MFGGNSGKPLKLLKDRSIKVILGKLLFVKVELYRLLLERMSRCNGEVLFWKEERERLDSERE
jgi:hypothetical protein